MNRMGMLTIWSGSLFLLLACSGLGGSGLEPFGFPLGGTISTSVLETHGCAEVSPSYYACETAPVEIGGKTETYLLVRLGDGRVAQVGAITGGDTDGAVTRAKFEDLKQVLTDKYGDPTGERDDVEAGSMWADQEFFAMSLKMEERFLMAAWEVDGVSIFLKAVTNNGLSSAVKVVYIDGDLMDVYEKEKKSTNAGAL